MSAPVTVAQVDIDDLTPDLKRLTTYNKNYTAYRDSEGTEYLVVMRDGSPRSVRSSFVHLHTRYEIDAGLGADGVPEDLSSAFEHLRAKRERFERRQLAAAEVLEKWLTPEEALRVVAHCTYPTRAPEGVERHVMSARQISYTPLYRRKGLRTLAKALAKFWLETVELYDGPLPTDYLERVKGLSVERLRAVVESNYTAITKGPMHLSLYTPRYALEACTIIVAELQSRGEPVDEFIAMREQARKAAKETK